MSKAAPSGSPGEPATDDDAQDRTIQELRSQLANLREHMDITIEKYETSIEDLKEANEELASMNEEHQAANEELETSQEELHSINEELSSVNGELAANIEALAVANEDMANLFESSAIATVFLDESLRIRRYTPAVAGVFNLVPTDFGRMLTDIACQLDYPALRADLERVRSDGEETERLVSPPDGARKYLARTLPYHSAGGTIEGVILNFVDVTRISPSEERLRTLVEELNHRIRNLMAVVIGQARRSFGDIPEAHERVQAFSGRMNALTVPYGLLSDNKWQPVRLQELLKLMLANYLRQLLAHPNLARGGQPLVDDDIARPAGQDRCEDRPPRAVDHVSDGRGHGLARAVPADTRRHRGVATLAAGTMLRDGGMIGQAGRRQERCVLISAKSTRFASKRRTHHRLRREQRDHWPAGIARRQEPWLSFTEDARMAGAYGKCRFDQARRKQCGENIANGFHPKLEVRPCVSRALVNYELRQHRTIRDV